MGILILVFCVSCGHSVKETVKPEVPGTASDQFKKVVILPFADYTLAHSSYGFWRRNVLVQEALESALYQAGFVPAPQEDVVQYLLGRGVIQASSGGSAGTASLEQELRESWSDEMKEVIEKELFQHITSNKTQDGKKPIALDNQMLKDLGNAFGADYVVRGRIVEFRLGGEDTFNPLKTHILPFVFKAGKRTIFGITDSDAYAAIDNAAIGGTLRRFVDDTDLYSTDFLRIGDFFTIKNEDVERANGLFWDAGGVATGFCEKTGRVPKATVQLRMLVHDAKTGGVIWLNRAEASVTPKTAYGTKNDRYALFSKAIEKPVNSLVDDFAAAFASGRVARIDKTEPTEARKAAEAEEIMAEVEEAEEAAAEAKKSAGKAKESARKAEEAAAQATKASGEAEEAVQKADKASVKTERIFEKIIAK